jgi:hypothetical protein
VIQHLFLSTGNRCCARLTAPSSPSIQVAAQRGNFAVLYHLMVADPDENILTAIAYLRNANGHLRANLEVNDQVLAEAELRLKQGQSITATLRLLPSLSDRMAAENAVSELYGARHNMRRAVVAAALKDGMSVGELANRVELTPEQVQTIANDNAWQVD